MSGLVLMVGSVLFLTAAFLPYGRVFTQSEPAVRLEILHRMKTLWSIGQVLFALGSVVTVLGLALLVNNYRGNLPGSWVWLALAVMLIGSLLWSWHCMERMSSPEGFVNGTNTPYLFLIYSILTQTGLIIFGIFLLGTGLPAWTGWMLIAGTALLSILMIIFKDMPPFTYYLITLILAIKVLAAAGVVRST